MRTRSRRGGKREARRSLESVRPRRRFPGVRSRSLPGPQPLPAPSPVRSPCPAASPRLNPLVGGSGLRPSENLLPPLAANASPKLTNKNLKKENIILQSAFPYTFFFLFFPFSFPFQSKFSTLVNLQEINSRSPFGKDPCRETV